MYYVKHRRKISGKALTKVRITVLIIAVLLLLIAINSSFRRVVMQSAEISAQNRFTSSGTAAVLEVINEGQSFDIIDIEMNSEGRAVSIESDTGQINQIKALLSEKMLAKLKEDGKPVRVSLGSLSGIELLSGRGGEIEVRLEIKGGVSTQINSEFYEAGINQTLHRVYCIMSADYYLIIPGHKILRTFTTTVPLAESVIVGEVPDAFTYVVGDESDTISRIFDYGHLE